MTLTPRQAGLADAGLAVLARDGLGAVSFRAVASEAGLSVGAVQKAFGTKQALLHGMFQRLRRSAAAPAGEPGRPDLRTWLVTLTLQVLPLDGPRRARQLQGNAFGELALRDRLVATALREEDDALVRSLEALVRRAVVTGEIDAATDAAAAARLWVALVAGLAGQLLYDPRTEAEVLPLVETAVLTLLPPRRPALTSTTRG